jgi:type IV pilus assembly protein PilB
MPKPRLGDVLKQSGAVSDSDLDSAVLEQKDRSVLLGELLLQKRLVSKEQLAAALQKITGVAYADCGTVQADVQALEYVSRELALRYCCLPVSIQGRELVMVMTEPQNLQFLDDLRFITGMEISPRLGFQKEIKAAINRYFPETFSGEEEQAQETETAHQQRRPPDIEFYSSSAGQKGQDAIKEFQAALRSKPTAAVRLVSIIISSAESKNASDIHIDPQATETVIRVRVDGILRDLMQVPHKLSSHLISRIKILADLDIAERRTPQDGRFLVRVGKRKLDLRVSTLPTHYGEKVVMRLLDPDATRTSFVDLGFSKENSQALLHALAAPQGLILVCGPTGSGKTTTLYSALHQVSARSVNIITVEDPIEYMLEGINQVQVNRKAGLTFAGSLRSILRQDPNIVMVGEIRDKETAEIASTAAQTGHLVLSTLHTNDSVSAIDRLRDLGIPGFLIASSLTAVLSQRLVRKLCSCRAEKERGAATATSAAGSASMDLPAKLYVPVGCPECDQAGHQGRVAVVELLLINDEIRRLIQNNAGADEIRAAAAAGGMQFLRDDALEKLKAGWTSLEEVLRVIPMKERSAMVCHRCGRELLPGFAFCPSCGNEVGKSAALRAYRDAEPGGVPA